MNKARKVRIGIDVGGTFTHAVAVDNDSLQVLAHQVTPTTHNDPRGVAGGIISSFSMLAQKLTPEDSIIFLAHSTTQATNALLEGDVAKVGIVGLGKGIEALKARSDLEVGDLELTPGKFLRTQLDFIEPKQNLVKEALERLSQGKCGAIVAAQGFSVDDPSGELMIIEEAREQKLPACGTHQMSGLYGLRVRARTAVVNASILPKMIETAELTHQALAAKNLQASLMIMRSDGGVMSLEEVRKRPVMTLLSGPAAGVAAALMFLKASDAIFLEVGGTSTDICLIKDGKAAVRSAVIGGHPTYLKTLDSRTLGIAGGSMIGPRAEGGLSVGPRSAHVAGYPYCSFAKPLLGELNVREIHPQEGDPAYFVIEDSTGYRASPTTTCAANLLGHIKHGDYSATNSIENLNLCFSALAAHLKIESVSQLAHLILIAAAEKIVPTIMQLLKDYSSSGRVVKLIGGGGGAGAIVPIVAEKLGFPYEIAQQAEVISAIGAAMAMVKETIERNIVNPSQEDLARIRSEAKDKVLAMGADPASIEVSIAIDAQKSLVTAVATGSIAFSEGETGDTSEVSPEERLQALRDSTLKESNFTALGDTGYYYVFQSLREEKYLFNLLKKTKNTLWVTDRKGNVKLQVPQGILEKNQDSSLESGLAKAIAKYTSYGDAGALIPAIYALSDKRLVDLTSLTTAEQALTLARQEFSDLTPDASTFFLIRP